MKYPFSATAGSTLFYALLLWETSTNPTNLYVTKKKNSTLSNLLYTYAPHNRLAVSLLLILNWYNKSFCNEGCTLSQVCTQLQKFFASTRKIATTARLAFIAIFRCSLSHLQNLHELREITGWAIFQDTWHFRFFFVTLKTNSKSSCGF